MSEPLDRVLLRTQGEDYEPEHPNRPPWLTEKPRRIEYASSGDVATVRLEAADRAQVHGLGRRERETPELWEDQTPESWGVSSPHPEPAA
jgi:hypothetical protein